MEFWRIFRLVWGKRWLILGIMIISVLVIMVGATIKGQQKLYEAVAIISPLETAQAQTGTGANESAPPPAAATQQEISSRISELVMQLRSSNDLYLRTAELLRQSQTERTESVKRILEKNGYFAQVDSEVESQVKRALAQREINPSEAPAMREKQRQENRSRVVASLVEAKDALGAFREGGIELSPTEVTDRIRQKMTFDVVTGPLDSDSNRQVVNQVRIAGRFDREAEANLYVNMLCVAFIDFYTTKNAGTANARIALTNEKLKEAQRQLEEAQKAESLYRKQRDVAVSAAQESIISQYLQLQSDREAAQQSYNQAVAAVGQLRQQLAAMPEMIRSSLPSEENPQVRELQLRVSNARINLQKLREMNYGEEWDTVVLAKAELKGAEKALSEAQQRGFGITSTNPNHQNLEMQLASAQVLQDQAQQKVNGLNQQVTDAAIRMRSLPEAQFTLGNLRRDTVIADRNVTTLAEQMRKYELQAIDESKAGSINIVSQAHSELVGGDIAKQRPKLLVFGLILSLICGIVLVVGMDALDNSIRTVQDVERALKAPVIGVIPEHLPDPIRAPRVTYLSPLAPVSESYRLLRTDLMFSVEEKPFRSLMVATGKPGQGATTTVSNLAITLAQAGKRVILVDTDLRFPKLHKVFGLPNDIGLTSLLREETNVEDALLSTDIRNLQVLTSGPIPVNPSEMLGTERMRMLHEQLKKLADFVLFDTPSAVAFADASVLSSFIDVTMLVVRASNVPRGSEDLVLRLLNKAHANIIGVVLNGVPSEQVDSVHYHEEYYPQLPVAMGGNPGPYSDKESVNAGMRPPLPLALPDEGTRGIPGQRSAVVANTNTAVRPIVLQTVKPSPPLPRRRRPINWRMLLVALTVGIVLGTIILRVAISVNVR